MSARRHFRLCATTECLEWLLVSRADWFVSAAAAEEAGLGGEVSGADVGGGFLDGGLGFGDLLGVARGFLALVVLQVVKNQTGGIPFEDFFGGEGVDAELQVFAGVRVLLRLAGFVVDDFHVFAAQRVYLVHAAGEDYVVF